MLKTKVKEELDEPPILERETYDYADEEDDNFVEMEEETDEEDEPSSNQPSTAYQAAPVIMPVSPKYSYAVQEQEEEIELEVYNLQETSSKAPRKYAFDHSKYLIEFRNSHYKNKSKNSHKVAIIARVEENVCHEFSYNRTSDYDGSKYFTCLGCRKAKNDTRVKDVIRTVRIDDRYRQILSKGDPFLGHHYDCQPKPWSPDARSYGHVLPQPMHMDLGEYAPTEIVYMDADGTESIWEPSDNYSSIPFYGEEGPPQSTAATKVVKSEKLESVEKSLVEIPSYYQRYKNKKKMKGKKKPKCHLCFAVLETTKSLVEHLQNHLKMKKRRKKNNKR